MNQEVFETLCVVARLMSEINQPKEGSSEVELPNYGKLQQVVSQKSREMCVRA